MAQKYETIYQISYFLSQKNIKNKNVVAETPVALLKSIKNSVEIKGMFEANLRAASVRPRCVQNACADGTHTCAARLQDDCTRVTEHCVQPFATVSFYNGSKRTPGQESQKLMQLKCSKLFIRINLDLK